MEEWKRSNDQDVIDNFQRGLMMVKTSHLDFLYLSKVLTHFSVVHAGVSGFLGHGRPVPLLRGGAEKGDRLGQSLFCS
jgi:hypothetical protein